MQATRREINAAFHPSLVSGRDVSSPPEPGRGPPDESVYLIESDSRMREEISGALKSFGKRVIGFETAQQYLDYKRPNDAACLILQLDLPDRNNGGLQQQIAGGMSPSLIYISEHPDVAATVRAMKAGAIEVLIKPVDPIALVDAVQTALANDRKTRVRKAELARLQERFALLTPREREVLPLIVGGLLNKQAASILGISEVTLQIHRSQAMRKMQAESFADLVRMAMKLRIPYRLERRAMRDSGPKVSICRMRSGSNGLTRGTVHQRIS